MTKRIKVKLELQAYCDQYDYDFVQSFFSNIKGIIGEKTITVRYICGAGKILSCDDMLHGLLPGIKSAFCGFIDNDIGNIMDIPVSCVVPMTNGRSYEKAVEAGVLLPIIAAFNAANVVFGENIMVICNQKYRDITVCLLELLGCIPFVTDIDTLCKSDEFYHNAILKTSGYGMDAVVLLHKETERFKHLIPKTICPNRSRITFADGIGIGYDDMTFMLAEKSYPVGYVGKTPKENLMFALRLLERNEQLSNACKTITKDAVHNKKAEFDSEKAVKIPDCKLTDEQVELKYLIKERHSACLLQMSVQCSEITDKSIDIAENKAVNMIESIPSSKQDINASNVVSRTVVFCDGSVAVINCIAGFKEKIRIELHWDGKTAISENGIITKYI
jgi:hypothetical protein